MRKIRKGVFETNSSSSHIDELIIYKRKNRYINAVDGYFAPSSRTKEGIVDWNSTTIKQYYKKLRPKS